MLSWFMSASIYQNDWLDELIPNLALVSAYNEAYACKQMFIYVMFYDNILTHQLHFNILIDKTVLSLRYS